jgi:hypothetical protein
MLAEQQRAKSEIEAALTIAAARPRDEKEALDRILISCQRTGVAEKATYQYAKGGTDITGPTIRLLEVVAQKWGNVEFGFRELARYPGQNGQPGESLVEAVAWDLESNTRRRAQFTVPHAERTKKGLKVFTDPREVYEWIANQAQRRVRTCLENIIPRDVVDAACEQCDQTLKASVKVTPELIAKLATAFAAIGVKKEAIEERIQRRMDSITAAQVVGLRKIYTSISEGMSRADDWFKTEPAAEPPANTVLDKAKDALRKQADNQAAPPEVAAPVASGNEPSRGDPPPSETASPPATGTPRRSAPSRSTPPHWSRSTKTAPPNARR